MSSQGVPAVLADIEAAEKQLSEQMAWTKKLKARLTKAQKDIAKAKPVSRLTAFVADLKALPGTHALDLGALTTRLDHQLRSLVNAYGSSFGQTLHQHGQAVGVAVRPLHDGFAVGPFALTVDVAKEVGSFHYGKVLLVKDLPLEPDGLVKIANDLATKLLQTPAIDLVRKHLEEAMRVALVRQKKSVGGELRVDLPSVYREMAYIRQGAGKSSKGSGYSLARFVVELKTLIQSDENTSGDRRFRLETAVLENTKDPRKSVFVPNDVSVGYGEGTYYQAIVLINPT